ncbi:MAG: HipA domain-containing protein [Propionibacteriaceae bacterium]|nr:HipA domain-containing protein [Propionibacteriaceae bacterium]
MPPTRRRTDRAEVYKAGRPAATLTRTTSGVRFEYLTDYDGPPVAHSLPLTEAVETSAGAVPPFFAGLLPEGRRLNALRRQVKTSSDDELSLLLAIGSDTVGDVVVVAEGDEASGVIPTVSDSRDLKEIRFTDLLAEAGFVDRVGIAGVQDKLSAGMITLPVKLGAGAAIIKIDPPDYPHAVVNEHYFLGVARRLKHPVVASEIVHDRDGRPGLLLPRFDRRVRSDGSTLHLAVEDACQLLSRYPADKYNVTSEEVSTAISSACAAEPVAARACFQQFLLAWLTGNGDLHAKNVSILQEPGGEWRVAPIYDIPSTLPYGDRTMALTLQGTATNLGRRRFEAFGAALGLSTAAIERALDEVLRATEAVADELDDGVLPWDPHRRRTLVRQLAARRRSLTG